MSMEEKYKGFNCLVVYDNSEWSIYLKSRNHKYEGQPNMKVWIARKGIAVAQYTDKYRGYNEYRVEMVGDEIIRNGEELIPEPIRDYAKETWEDLCAGVYTDEKLAKIREQFIRGYEAEERRARERANKRVS